jgi:hypothetical protein
MEIIRLGGLSMIGYQLSKNKRQNNDDNVQQMHINDKYVPTLNESLYIDQPEFHQNMQPFYTSQKTQNTNDSIKDRRLATFTGINNLEYVKKKETLSIEPEPNSNPLFNNGVTFEPHIERYSEYIASNKHNNVSSTPKQIVGPGLGMGIENNPNQGFHPTFRILPENVNSYKKNNLIGSVNHGKQNVDNRSQLPGQNTQYTNKLRTEDNEFVNGVMSSVSAMTQRPQVLLEDQKQNTFNCVPPAGPSGSNGPLINSQYMMTKNDNNQNGCIFGNPSSQIAPSSNQNYLVHENVRSNTNPHILNTQLPTASINPRFDNYDNTTLRDNKNCQHLNMSTSTFLPQAYQTENVPTQRGILTQQTYTNPSNPNGHQLTNVETPTLTQRGTSNSYIPQPHTNGIMDYKTAYMSEPNLSREHVISTQRNPNGERVNIPLDTSHLNFDMKNDNHPNTFQGGVYAQGLQNFTNTNDQGMQTTKSVDPYNTREFGFSSNLKNNPYSISITN